MSLPNPNAGENLRPAPILGTGGTENDYDAIAAGAGIIALDGRLVVRITGDDRVTFLHGMCSNDIKGLPSGAVSPALILTEHAHVIADLFIYAAGDALLIEIDRALWPNARAHLEKFLVADDVEIKDLDSLGVIDIEGPEAARAVATVAGDAALSLPPWRHAESADMRIANLPRFGASAFTIFVDHARIASLIEQMRERCASAAIREVGPGALDIVRVENGVARIGTDTTDKTIALEARLDSAISYSKGCYVGQETIERATARGGLKKKLSGLRIEGQSAPAAGSSIVLDGKEVGHLTSIAHSRRFGLIGLSILHHSAWSTGTRVTIAGANGEMSATVSELPFA